MIFFNLYILLCILIEICPVLDVHTNFYLKIGKITFLELRILSYITTDERGGAGVETQKNVRGEVGGWGRVPFNEPYAPSLSTIYDGA